jgi:hypothetical protein
MSDPLTSPWIRELKTRIEPRLTRIQRSALAYVWDWFERYWRADGEYPQRAHSVLVEELLPYFKRLEEAAGTDAADIAIESLGSHLESMPEPEVIDGVLYEQHKHRLGGVIARLKDQS